MRNVYYLAKHHHALNTFPDLCQFVLYQRKNEKQMETNKEIKILRLPPFQEQRRCISPSISTNNKYATYANPVSGREMLSSVSYIIEEAVMNEVRSSPFWSMLIDESNTIVQEKTIVFVSKHLVDNEPVIRFLGISQVTDGSSNAIVDLINKFISQKGLNKSKLFHFGSDGASNMIGEF